MLRKLFNGKKEEQNKANEITIIGLRIGHSFEVDPLLLRLIESELVIEESNKTHIIQAAGIVDLGGAYVFRFYTDDDAFLQVVTEGGKSDNNVVDVKLYHYYDTHDVSSDQAWDDLLYRKIGTPSYELENHRYERVWTSIDEYHQPVHMAERTIDETGSESRTDQFTMLFEREISSGMTESLFLSAEEAECETGDLNRCFVLSTGITLTSSQLVIHG